MTNVLTFTAHRLYRCPRDCEGCYICNGGLSSCITCNGAESSLTTDCCLRPMDGAELDRVSEGVLNYRGGEWLCEDAAKVPKRRRK